MSQNAIRELAEGELTEVTGGMLTSLAVQAVRQVYQGLQQGGTLEGGAHMNDTAQAFQQVLTQLSQGQG